ncbi:hypothetical protein K2173_024950 [Erythroxylum novogranatense]|uniref:Pentatricopeptide repeat-containing protein n=1 Tax=Erythroxylum novogranatense TaxID=1862640 RepID=A0AAV8UCK9_9ROSI|nr:hypothetical protein K2173_024950 [Erythroxylum novogranatense]
MSSWGPECYVTMLEQQARFLLWSPTERKCLFLLQRSKTKKSLLQIQAFMILNSVGTNVNIFTKFILSCAAVAARVPILDALDVVRYARQVFDMRPHRDDAFLCNAMIKAHVGMRQIAESLNLYGHLRRDTGFIPNHFTFTTLAKSCGLSMTIREGLEIHNHVLKMGFYLNLYVSTALLDMYVKCENLGLARKLFEEMSERSLVSWTALIVGYMRSGHMGDAVALFDQMPEKDCAVYNAMIDGYVKAGDMNEAYRLFSKMPSRNVISWTSLINGYCSNGDVSSARSLFDAMPEKNLFSWNAIIGGHCQNKQPNEALKLFREMQLTSSFEPDEVTIVSILPAIADLGALELGRWVHKYVCSKKLDRTTNVCTALVDMYAKCGEVSKARKIFDEMARKEIITWNALINGLAINGRANEALEVFFEMQREGIKPNDVTMLAVLSACNHGGLVDEGKKWLKEMDEFGLEPKIEHFGCLVDLLGRAGYLEEAEKLIKAMPYEANGVILSSFLFACGYFKDVKRAEKVLKQILSVEPENDGNYTMLRNLYAKEEQWRNVEEVKVLMRTKGAKKETGSSAIEIDNSVSEFLSGGRAHPQWDAIHSMVEFLRIHMRDKTVTQNL